MRALRACLIAGLLLFSSVSHAQTSEGCALAFGRDPSGNLIANLVAQRPHSSEAMALAAAPFRQPGFQYIDGRLVDNGAAALSVFYDLTGNQRYQLSVSSDALGAIRDALFWAGGAGMDKRRAPYVKWVRCSNTAPVTQEQLAQLTWGSSLTSMYPGYQVQVADLKSTEGALFLIPSGGAQPPAPTPAPPTWSGAPVGCWARINPQGQAEGNVVQVVPRQTSNSGQMQYEGTHVALSPSEQAVQFRLGDVGLSLTAVAGDPTHFQGVFTTLDKRYFSATFKFTGDTLVIEEDRPQWRYSWRRVACR